MVIKFMATEDADRALLPPERASQGAAGFDICANLSHDVTILPQEIALLPTGLMIQLPHSFEAQIRPRSGLAIKSGITVVNAPGTIDWDYRGEIMIGLINLSRVPFAITHGMRIAQMVFARVEIPNFEKVGTFAETKRGEGGFGSTGRT